MNSAFLRSVLEELLAELGELSPRELDAKLGVSRGATSPTQVTKALEQVVQARINKRVKSKPPVELTVIRSDDKTVRIEDTDLIVKIGPKTDVVQIALTVPRSVGVFLDITRYKVDPKLLPSLSDGQRKLLAAAAHVSGTPTDKLLRELLSPFLRESLQELLTAEDIASRRKRESLTAVSLFPQELIGLLLSLD